MSDADPLLEILKSLDLATLPEDERRLVQDMIAELETSPRSKATLVNADKFDFSDMVKAGETKPPDWKKKP